MHVYKNNTFNIAIMIDLIKTICYFRVFDLEDSEDCGSDYVEIRELSNLTNLLGRFCGNRPPTNLTIAKSMYVKFKSDEDNEGTGFMAQFTTCKSLVHLSLSSQHTAVSGTFPNYVRRQFPWLSDQFDCSESCLLLFKLKSL